MGHCAAGDWSAGSLEGQEREWVLTMPGQGAEPGYDRISSGETGLSLSVPHFSLGMESTDCGQG